MALTKIYKSRDGLTAVSSNTSIMSELSNLSKTSLPSSIPTSVGIRHASISSSTSSSIKAHSLLIQKQPMLNSSGLSEPKQVNGRFQASTPAKTSHLLRQIVGSTQLDTIQQKKASIQLESKPTLKKPGQTKPEAAVTPQTLLTINTALGNTARTLSSCSSPSTSTISTKNKTELKLNNEIKRLEALCESRTKELTMLKLRLRDTIMSFDAIAVAFKYLSNDVNF